MDTDTNTEPHSQPLGIPPRRRPGAAPAGSGGSADRQTAGVAWIGHKTGGRGTRGVLLDCDTISGSVASGSGGALSEETLSARKRGARAALRAAAESEETGDEYESGSEIMGDLDDLAGLGAGFNLPAVWTMMLFI